MRRLIFIIKNYIRVKKLKHKNLYIYKPYSIYISPTSKIKIDGSLFFNKTHNEFQKKKLSVLVMGENSEINVFGQFLFFSGCRVGVLKGAKLKLGSGYINFDSKIYCYNSITIGNNVAISENVTIIDSDVHEIIGQSKPISQPINIKDNVWIGLGVTILKGVTIGEGAIIGAGSVVTKDIPANSLAVGNPAKVIKTNIQWK